MDETIQPEGEGMNPTDTEEVSIDTGEEEKVSVSRKEYERLTKAEEIRKQEVARRKKAEDKVKHDHAETKETSTSDDVLIARLEARGVLEEEDQEYIKKVMRRESLSLQEAMKDDMVKDRLALLKRKRETEDATPRPSKGTGTGGKDVEYYVNHPKENAPDAKTRSEVLRRLARKNTRF